LDHRLLPHGVDRIRQAFQPVAHEHEHVGDTPVLDLGEHVQPELRSVSAVAGPDPEDVAFAVHGDPDRHVERLVRDLAVADFDHDRVDEHHRVHLAVSIGRCES